VRAWRCRISFREIAVMLSVFKPMNSPSGKIGNNLIHEKIELFELSWAGKTNNQGPYPGSQKLTDRFHALLHRPQGGPQLDHLWRKVRHVVSIQKLLGFPKGSLTILVGDHIIIETRLNTQRASSL